MGPGGDRGHHSGVASARSPSLPAVSGEIAVCVLRLLLLPIVLTGALLVPHLADRSGAFVFVLVTGAIYASALLALHARRGTRGYRAEPFVDLLRLGVRVGEVELCVSDDGSGIDPARRGDAVARGQLGLATLTERVAAAGGRLDVYGGGTTAVATLPAAARHASG
jgi:hypothetical protein